MRIASLVIAAVAVGAVAPARQAAPPQTGPDIVYDQRSAPIAFGVADLRAALEGQRQKSPRPADVIAPRVTITTVAATMPGQPVVSGLTSQGYAIRRVTTGGTTRWWVVGADAAGAMYGALELAETVRIDGSLAAAGDRQVTPTLANRGIKFNIPLDARTPSYSDDATSAQANIAEMWSLDFWTRFLDEMARHRYNGLTLWSLSPFPSLVKVPEYPKVALSDVKKKIGPLWDATLQGNRMYDASWPLETVRTMTIDEKIAFWRTVMQHARDRGIEVSLFTWNIFVYGTEGSGYGITESPDNATTKDYVRRSVRALFNTYPLLAGIGITAGENMGPLNDAGKEQWLWETYGLGVTDAMADARNAASPFFNPTRTIRLIHRAHQADLASIVSTFKALPGYDAADSTLAFSFKYSQAHMHATTSPRFIYQNGWFSTIPAGKRTWLTVRNDDMYYLRWGDPDFVRDYVTHLPDLSKIAGFYMGPDGYTWGREFLGRDATAPRALVIDKMWYSFLLWGRLTYEPALPNRRLQQIVGARFPEVASAPLFAGWTSVSKILPLVTRFYWGSLDFMWYPEACWSNTGFATVQDFITPKYPPMRADEDGASPRLQSVKGFVDGEALDGRLTPLQVADQIEQHAMSGLDRVRTLQPGANRELRETLGDIRAMAWLGRYYAEKIRGAVDLYRYQKTRDGNALTAARTHLQAASAHWREYASIWGAQYVPQVLTRMGLTPVDVQAMQAFVDRDVPDATLR